jgi:hypothetical protein
MDKINHMDALKTALSEFERTLLSLGLRRSSSELFQNPNFGWHEYDVFFTNYSGTRFLKIHCAPEIPACLIGIGNSTRENDEQDYFLLDSYLRAYENDELKNFEDFYRANRSTISALEYFRGFFVIAGKYLESDLKDVIQGHRWENVPADRSLLDY